MIPRLWSVGQVIDVVKKGYSFRCRLCWPVLLGYRRHVSNTAVVAALTVLAFLRHAAVAGAVDAGVDPVPAVRAALGGPGRQPQGVHARPQGARLRVAGLRRVGAAGVAHRQDRDGAVLRQCVRIVMLHLRCFHVRTG